MDDSTLDLAQEELRETTATVVAAAGNPSEPFGLYGFTGASKESALPRAVERNVFAEQFGNSPVLLAAEYGAYESSTFFFCVVDHRRTLPVGSVRLLLPSPVGFKTLADIERTWGLPLADTLRRSDLDLDVDRVWDVATIAVDREYRGKVTQSLVSGSLYQAICRGAYLAEVGWVIAVLDLIVLDLIQTISHDAYQRFAGCEPMQYLDSPASLPVYCDVDAYLPRLAEVDPATYSLLIDGRGMEEAVRPPDWDALVDSLAAVTRSTAP
ncbi:MAG: hypothetical protein ACXW2C_06170 [Acidimicrobiia bacterium]